VDDVVEHGLLLGGASLAADGLERLVEGEAGLDGVGELADEEAISERDIAEAPGRRMAFGAATAPSGPDSARREPATSSTRVGVMPRCRRRRTAVARSGASMTAVPLGLPLADGDWYWKVGIGEEGRSWVLGSWVLV
jgi:hypothetical protein